MRLSGLFIYPIKSLNGISLDKANVTSLGLEHDRKFMLAREKADGSHEYLLIGKHPQLCFYNTAIDYQTEELLVTSKRSGELRIPLAPDTHQLKMIRLLMASSDIVAYDMGPEYALYFSQLLGKVKLLFCGKNSRKVMINKPQDGWLSLLKDWRIAFADVAPLLVVSTESLDELTSATPHPPDMRKFRPNLVISGAQAAWDEDFWSELDIGGKRVILTGGCARCQSTTVDFETGRYAPSREPLKTLQKYRRIDTNYKYSPVFGRYAFCNGDGCLRVGEHVLVLKRSETYTNLAKIDFNDTSPPLTLPSGRYSCTIS